MQDFVRVYGRIAGAAAGAAFVLSLLVGLLSRNPFGVALLRAVILALLFAALGAGLRYVFTKYLAETAPAQASAPAESSGRNVDITLPEEAPPVLQPVRERAPERMEPETEDVLGGLEGARETVPGPELSEAPGALSDALDDELPPLVDTDSGTGAHGGSVEAAVDAVEEAESVAEDGPEPSSSRPGRTPRDPAMDSGLDTLPDISSLGAGPPRKSADPGPRPGRRTAADDSAEDAMKKKLSGEDPATLARALRTVLKRDEKG